MCKFLEKNYKKTFDEEILKHVILTLLEVNEFSVQNFSNNENICLLFMQLKFFIFSHFIKLLVLNI